MTKRALLVGINYPGTSHALRGCVNDVHAILDLLTTHYGFDQNNIGVLTDELATTQNIKDSLDWLVRDAIPGDTLFFHYSGHGSQIMDDSDPDYEPDGLDEILCPVDLDWNTKVIRDDDLKRVFDKVPLGVNLTAVLDCCHSGGGMDHSSQHQPLGSAVRSLKQQPTMEDDEDIRSRYLPPPSEVQAKIGTREVDMGFKERSLQTRDIDKTGMMISGCQSHQTSADAYIDGKYRGACTYYLIDTLKHHQYNIDYMSLVNRMNVKMVEEGYTQRPELNGPIFLYDRVFLYEGSSQSSQSSPAVEHSAPRPEFIMDEEECTGFFCFDIMRKFKRSIKRRLKRGFFK